MVNKLKLLLGDTYEGEESLLELLLEMAGDSIINKLYPFQDHPKESDDPDNPVEPLKVPERYQFLQLEIASYLYSKRGAEGETWHSENGIARSWGGPAVPKEYLEQIMPFVGIPREITKA